jgi:hypothetical protein
VGTRPRLLGLTPGSRSSEIMTDTPASPARPLSWIYRFLADRLATAADDCPGLGGAPGIQARTAGSSPGFPSAKTCMRMDDRHGCQGRRGRVHRQRRARFHLTLLAQPTPSGLSHAIRRRLLVASTLPCAAAKRHIRAASRLSPGCAAELSQIHGGILGGVLWQQQTGANKGRGTSAACARNGILNMAASSRTAVT